MKHTLFTLLFAVVASLGTIFAQSGTCGNNLTWNLTDGVLTISGTGAMEDYTSSSKAPWFAYRNSINSVVIGEGVSCIGKWTFSNCDAMSSATIGNSVASIGDYAFFECGALTSIGIPNSVTIIGNGAFLRCTGLESVAIPGSVTHFGDYAFYQCSSLSSVVIAYGVTSIGFHAFDECSNLASVSLPNSVTIIEEAAFRNCSSLTSVTIPNSVISIGESAFRSCTSLTSVSIPNNVASIGNGAFAGGWSLTSVTIPNSVTSIDESAFGGCSYITSITNHAIVPQVIVESTFNNVNKYACTLYVPAESIALYQAANVWKDFRNILAIEGSEEINYASLADIYNMAADSIITLGAFDVMYVPDFQSGSNMYIKDSTGSCVIYKVNYGLQAGDHVEAGLQGRVSIYNGLHEIIPITTKEDLTITSSETPAPVVATEVPSLSNASQYVVYEGVTFATDTAFVEGRRHAVNGSWNGQTITFYNQYYIGATLSTGKTYNITAVNSIYRTTPQAYPLAVEEIISDTPEPCIIASGTCGAQGDNLTWTLTCDSVLTISGTGAMADYNNADNMPAPWFQYHTFIQSVIIEDGITSIGFEAFWECDNLQSVDIPNSVVNIEAGAFCNCYNLESVTIPSSVTNIGAFAFYNCHRLTSITIPSSVATLGRSPFGSCINVPSIEVANDNPNYCSVDGVLFNKQQTILIQYPAGKANSTYTIPSSVTDIQYCAFSSCSWLNTITIGNHVTNIDAQAFYGCSGLTSMVIPNSITKIGDHTFYNCTSLISVTIPSSVMSIGEGAFAYCRSLTSVTNYATEPQVIVPITFYYVNLSSCTLYVPAQSLAAYQAADVWKDFGNILPIEGTVDGSILSIAEAIQIGMALDSMATSAETFTIEGYVISAEEFSTIYKNQNWYMVDDVNEVVSDFQAYRCYPISGLDTVEVKDGAKVRITGKLQKYYNRATARYIIEMTKVPALILQEAPECLTYSGSCGDNLTWTLTCDSILTISGTGKMWDAADLKWLLRAQKIKTVILQDGVKNIGVEAFAGCTNLLSASIPETVDSIGQRAFMNCINLRTVNMPNSVHALGHQAFVGCNSLTEPVYNQRIFGYMPRYYSGSYSIPEGIVSVAAYSFTECNDLKEIVIPSSVERLGRNSLVAPNLNKIISYAVTPPICVPTVFEFEDFERGGTISVNKSIPVYVPQESLAAYQTADEWKEFFNILPIEGEQQVEPTEGEFNVLYVGQEGDLISSEPVMLHLPIAPEIEGFTFLKWQVAAGDLENGIVIQAVYQAAEPTSAPEVYTNPANPAQKLIRNGHVYILTDDKIFTITGQEVR